MPHTRCGLRRGGLLDSLRNLGFTDLTGLDPAEACAAEVSRRGHRGVSGSVGTAPLQSAAFDGIILSHVLEHVLDLKSTLATLSALLRPDGWLYVEVPDANRYRDYLIAPWQDFNLEHINHFSLESLRNVLMISGWQVCREGKKTISLGADRFYPAIYAISHFSSERVLESDHSTYRRLVEYSNESESRMMTIDSILRKHVTAGPVAVWGAGQLTMRLLGGSVLSNAKIDAIIDGNPVLHGKVLRGVAINSPSDFLRSGFVDVPIVIGSMVNLESIETTIRSLGLPNRVVDLCNAEPV